MKTVKVSFKSEDHKISGILHLPDRKRPPCVIASHGLLSSKDSEKYIALGHRMSEEGMVMLRFDFRGIGESEGGEEDNTVSKKLVDLSWPSILSALIQDLEIGWDWWGQASEAFSL